MCRRMEWKQLADLGSREVLQAVFHILIKVKINLYNMLAINVCLIADTIVVTVK